MCQRRLNDEEGVTEWNLVIVHTVGQCLIMTGTKHTVNNNSNNSNNRRHQIIIIRIIISRIYMINILTKLGNIIGLVVTNVLTGQITVVFWHKDTRMGSLSVTKWMTTNEVATHNIDN